MPTAWRSGSSTRPTGRHRTHPVEVDAAETLMPVLRRRDVFPSKAGRRARGTMLDRYAAHYNHCPTPLSTATRVTTVRPADRRAALHLGTPPTSPRRSDQRVRTHSSLTAGQAMWPTFGTPQAEAGMARCTPASTSAAAANIVLFIVVRFSSAHVSSIVSIICFGVPPTGLSGKNVAAVTTPCGPPGELKHLRPGRSFLTEASAGTSIRPRPPTRVPHISPLPV